MAYSADFLSLGEHFADTFATTLLLATAIGIFAWLLVGALGVRGGGVKSRVKAIQVPVPPGTRVRLRDFFRNFFLCKNHTLTR